MRNIQNIHKCIKHINSFINVRCQRKQRKFLENPFSGSKVLGPGSWAPGKVPGLGSCISNPTGSLGSQVPLFKFAANE